MTPGIYAMGMTLEARVRTVDAMEFRVWPGWGGPVDDDARSFS